MIARLWPNGVVEFDTGLNSAIRRLRGALGDDAETPRYIETIPRRGYRFIGRLDSPKIPTPELPAATGAEFPAAGGQSSETETHQIKDGPHDYEQRCGSVQPLT